MIHLYHPLPLHPLPADTPVQRFAQGLPERVTLDDSALEVMTDLKRVKAVTVAPDLPIDTALQKMIHAGVRLLLVTHFDAQVLGLITARDIMGEEPVNLSSRERITREEITVADIMAPPEAIKALKMDEVSRAKVGDIVETLRLSGRQHAVVLDTDEEASGEVIRGIFSATQIGRQLGVEISAEGPAQSFAELEQLLNPKETPA